MKITTIDVLNMMAFQLNIQFDLIFNLMVYVIILALAVSLLFCLNLYLYRKIIKLEKLGE